MATSASRQRVVDDALALLALDELPQSSVLVFDRDLRFVIARGSALPRYGYQP